MARLDGRVAILTGGAKGIGKHYARALAAEGARLMIADIADGSEVAAVLARDYGANSVESAVTDVSDEGAVAALVARTMERFGKIDILVNNAALFAPLQETKCTEIDVATWDRVMAINLRGPFLLVKHVAPHMSAQRYGKIINAALWQDHQYRLRHRLSRHPLDAALRHLEGWHHGDDAGAVARARRARHSSQYAGAGLHHE